MTDIQHVTKWLPYCQSGNFNPDFVTEGVNVVNLNSCIWIAFSKEAGMYSLVLERRTHDSPG